MKKIQSLFFILIFLFIFSYSQAHNILKNLSPESIEKIQRQLIEQGYLIVDSDFKYGIYDEKTESAYDKSKEDEALGKLPPNLQIAEKIEESVFSKVIIFLKNLLKIFGV